SVVRIPYDSEKEDVRIIEARTFKPNGEIMRPESSAIFDMSAPEVWKASAYTNAKLRIVTFVGIEKGAILECRYKRIPKSKKLGIIARILSFCKRKKKEHFFGEVIFGGYEPIIKKEFTLVVPKGVAFKYKMINGEYVPEVKEEAKNIIYTWRLKNLPPIVKEPYMPNIREMVPRLIYSSFDSWDELGRWFARKFYRCIKMDREMRAKVEELSMEKTSEEAIRDIFLYVLNQYRNVDLDLGAAGYTPNKASFVYQVKYGDCRDKSILLVSMLREAGIEAFPTLINRSGVTVVKEVPSPKSFDDLIVAIKEGNVYYFLDPKAKNSRYGYLPEEEQGVYAFVVFDKGTEFVRTPASPIEANVSKSLMKLSVSPSGGVDGEIFCHLSGFYDREARKLLKDRSKKEREQLFATRVGAMQTGTKLVSYSVSNLNNLMDSVSIHVAFKADRMAPYQADVLTINLPDNPISFTYFADYVELDERQHPLITLSPRSIEYGVIVEIPWGFGIEYIPEKFTMENELAKAEVLCESKRTEITYKASFIIKKRKISIDEYEDFKKICD
ncbi:MAG TPA: DUF3857 domain-containing protein, partial [bacterium (Candidatus Stahlbacteria)]|nr:DUF3857 domain-containing protein [Candidatus Stahlbacteria bacterium]